MCPPPTPGQIGLNFNALLLPRSLLSLHGIFYFFLVHSVSII